MSYRIYRRQDAFLTAVPGDKVRSLMSPESGASVDGWDFVTTVPARGDLINQVIVTTLCDSTPASGMCWSVFLVSAATVDPTVFFDSSPDSGYSLDNLSPAIPTNFTIAYRASSPNELSWDGSSDPDFQLFQVYRGLLENFIPSPSSLVHQTAVPEWLDPVSEGWKYYYKVTAVDSSGNESPAATPNSVTAVGDQGHPTVELLALYQNTPNPFNPSTHISFTLSQSGRVELTVYDVTGRLVRSLMRGSVHSGTTTIAWNGKDDRGSAVSSGVYVYRLEAEGRVLTRKMVLLK